jgi:hypothetical protein
MPGYELDRSTNTLGLGRRRPLPNAVPAGGWRLQPNHPLAIRAAQ